MYSVDWDDERYDDDREREEDEERRRDADYYEEDADEWRNGYHADLDDMDEGYDW